eukprot:976959-Pelagomonas_calceolata.AAC.2
MVKVQFSSRSLPLARTVRLWHCRQQWGKHGGYDARKQEGCTAKQDVDKVKKEQHMLARDKRRCIVAAGGCRGQTHTSCERTQRLRVSSVDACKDQPASCNKSAPGLLGKHHGTERKPRRLAENF